VIYLKSSKINFFFFVCIVDENINFMFLSKCLVVFLKGPCFFKFEILLHDLIFKVCYKENLFYIITISIYGNLKYMIIKENFWTDRLYCRKRKYCICKRLIVLLTILICIILQMISSLKIEINKKKLSGF